MYKVLIFCCHMNYYELSVEKLYILSNFLVMQQSNKSISRAVHWKQCEPSEIFRFVTSPYRSYFVTNQNIHIYEPSMLTQMSKNICSTQTLPRRFTSCHKDCKLEDLFVWVYRCVVSCSSDSESFFSKFQIKSNIKRYSCLLIK